MNFSSRAAQSHFAAPSGVQSTELLDCFTAPIVITCSPLQAVYEAHHRRILGLPRLCVSIMPGDLHV